MLSSRDLSSIIPQTPMESILIFHLLLMLLLGNDRCLIFWPVLPCPTVSHSCTRFPFRCSRQHGLIQIRFKNKDSNEWHNPSGRRMRGESHKFHPSFGFYTFFSLAKTSRGLCNHMPSYLLFHNDLNAWIYQNYYKTYGFEYTYTCF